MYNKKQYIKNKITSFYKDKMIELSKASNIRYKITERSLVIQGLSFRLNKQGLEHLKTFVCSNMIDHTIAFN